MTPRPPDVPSPSGGSTAAAVPRPDDALLRDLYEAHGPAVFNYLLRHTGLDRHRAEDILQETLLRAWRNLDTLSTDVHSVRAWLYTVARNIAIDQIRAQRSRPAEFTDVYLHERADPHDGVESLINVGEVRAALAALPDRFREVLIEVYIRGRSIQEVAEAFDIPPGTVKSRTFYALQAMRKSMERRGFHLTP